VSTVLERTRAGAGAEMASMAKTVEAQILEHCWRPRLGRFAASYVTDDIDAALLQMVPLRFLGVKDSRVEATVEAVASELGRGGWVDRYRHDDGLGKPAVAFVLCTFWLVQALAGLGRHEEARRRLEATFGALSPLGLLAEDYDPTDRRLWGNYPQAYSHVGLIHAAFDASPRWPDVL
jgi:GH15 family glucan-1,4-alpha-glucosidase